MKLKKAIEINTELRELNFIDKNKDRCNAMKLGIEALKRFQALRVELQPKS